MLEVINVMDVLKRSTPLSSSILDALLIAPTKSLPVTQLTCTSASILYNRNSRNGSSNLGKSGSGAQIRLSTARAKLLTLVSRGDCVPALSHEIWLGVCLFPRRTTWIVHWWRERFYMFGWVQTKQRVGIHLIVNPVRCPVRVPKYNCSIYQRVEEMVVQPGECSFVPIYGQRQRLFSHRTLAGYPSRWWPTVDQTASSFDNR
jgi:hypothetical protein